MQVRKSFYPQQSRNLDPNHWLTPWVRQGIIAGPRRDATISNLYNFATATQGVQQGILTDELTGSSGYISAPTVADATPWTILSFGVLRSSGASASAVATVAEFPGDPIRDRSLCITSADKVESYIYTNSGIERYIASSDSVNIGIPSLIAAVATGSAISSFLYGKLISGINVSGDNNPYGYQGYATPELVVGFGGGPNGSGTSNPSASRWSSAYTLLIKRALTYAELLELEANPWAILEQRVVSEPSNFATGQRVHYTVIPATAAFPQAQDVISGWPGVGVATDYQSSTQTEDLTFNIDAANLAEGTNYKIAYVWYDGVNTSDVVVSAPFTTGISVVNINLSASGDASAANAASAIITTGVYTISDILRTGWTGSPDNTNLYTNINETSSSSAEYVQSPNLATTVAGPLEFNLNNSLAAGTWELDFTAKYTSNVSNVKLTLLDSGGASVGSTSWIPVASSFTLYTPTITSTGTATKIRIEVQ